MHRKLTIENFKCFSNKESISLGKITACLGCNSVGKSSVIQSLILLREIYEQSVLAKESEMMEVTIPLNGKYDLQLGDSEHIKSSKNRDDIMLAIDTVECKLRSIEDNPLEMTCARMQNLKEVESSGGVFSDDFYYLNAERLGPRNYQVIEPNGLKNCGVHGENTFHYYYKHGRDKVEELRCLNDNEEQKIENVDKQVEYWLNYIIPGMTIKCDDLNNLRLSQLQFQQTALDTGFLSPFNFGFGISYVLPIIVTGLTAKEGSMVLIENPEAHLHPLGQSRIGYFLARMAFAGVQIVVETHSEHVINGIRISSLEQTVSPHDVAINFFSLKEDEDSVVHCVERLGLNDQMDIQAWPDGFMDQEEKDLRRLRELRMRSD